MTDIQKWTDIKPRTIAGKYKTWQGAEKRAGFENGVAESEYRHGYKAAVYRYRVIAEDGVYRVQRYKKAIRASKNPA